MAKLDKLKVKLRSKPKDFTWDEAVYLLERLGYKKCCGSGSRRKFILEKDGKKSLIIIHCPHPGNTLKDYVVNILIKELADKGLL